MSDETDVILELEERRYQAMLNKDVQALEELCAGSLVYTHSNGSRDTKESLLKKLADGVFDYQWIEHPVDQVIIHGDTAMVVGQMRARVLSHGESKDLNNNVLAIWVNGPKGWRFFGYGPTPIA